MIIWGHSQREKSLGSGEFDCPLCATRRPYTYRVLSNWLHVYFIPLFEAEVVAEFVRCETCHETFSVDVLQLTGDDAGTRIPAWSSHDQVGSFGHARTVVSLTDSAVAEIRLRMATAGFESYIAVRVIPESGGLGCEIQFDDPYSDGRDWIGRSQDICILVDKEDAESIQGAVVDFQGSEFRLTY